MYYTRDLYFFQSICRPTRQSVQGFFLAGRSTTWWPVITLINQYVAVGVGCVCVSVCEGVYMPISAYRSVWVGCMGVLNKNLQVSQCMTMNVYSRWVV